MAMLKQIFKNGILSTFSISRHFLTIPDTFPGNSQQFPTGGSRREMVGAACGRGLRYQLRIGQDGAAIGRN